MKNDFLLIMKDFQLDDGSAAAAISRPESDRWSLKLYSY